MTDIATGEMPVEPVPGPPAPNIGVDVEAAPLEAAASAEHPIGSLRQAILDHLLDSVDAGPQSVAQILAALPPGVTRNTLESALKRAYDAGEIERVAPGNPALSFRAPARRLSRQGGPLHPRQKSLNRSGANSV